MRRVYLDHNATTPLRAEAREAMIAAMDVAGNPSSVHGEGRQAKALIERARAQVATALGADGADVIFTSSATEAACLLEIVRQNIADSGRSDSLDARALEAVQIWLADFAVGAGQGAAVNRLLQPPL